MLVDLLKENCGVDDEEIVLFRHTKDDVKVVKDCGASIEEWSAIQYVDDPKYDYRQNGKTKILAVIVAEEERDILYDVYRVGPTEVEGPRYSISSPELVESYRMRNRPNEKAFRVKFTSVPFDSRGCEVIGWRNRGICPVADSSTKFFSEIRVNS